ncbi:MAG: hypothetical protein M1831_004963 [Alyxoria varia]|nr:MAG: hypothetical protein M1831_004963 [Alyxoria varia]
MYETFEMLISSAARNLRSNKDKPSPGQAYARGEMLESRRIHITHASTIADYWFNTHIEAHGQFAALLSNFSHLKRISVDWVPPTTWCTAFTVTDKEAELANLLEQIPAGIAIDLQIDSEILHFPPHDNGRYDGKSLARLVDLYPGSGLQRIYTNLRKRNPRVEWVKKIDEAREARCKVDDGAVRKRNPRARWITNIDQADRALSKVDGASSKRESEHASWPFFVSPSVLLGTRYIVVQDIGLPRSLQRSISP